MIENEEELDERELVWYDRKHSCRGLVRFEMTEAVVLGSSSNKLLELGSDS